MINIQKMDEHHRYDVLDLWLRCTAAQNPFLEPNFWENNYNEIRSKYLENCENYLYMDGGRILAFICVSDNNYVKGLFVDPDYRGEFIVVLHNHGNSQQVIEHGERIAQLVITPVFTPGFVEVSELSDTQRSAGGFGSTGK